MTKIKMIDNAKGSLNGIDLIDFDINREYEVTDLLADAFVEHMKVAEYVDVEIKDTVEVKEAAKTTIKPTVKSFQTKAKVSK